ncbi:hypothetical protein [Mycoplasmopsis bovirhinis]|uniref:Uncharacterized protein n=1 Tax=Mycoplasmopsis bovirhinis TaxID=29553 RepID=A0A449ADG9_9BACT|nr:hypothetical protein [Mycoplasmopsis bovirhinis]VEU63025.1 Uncharacterised protein [Mycoplasmopsis bovirhinis]
MHIDQVKELFINILTSTPGIKEIHPVQHTINVVARMEISDLIVVYQLDNIWSFQACISILAGINAAELISEIHQKLTYQFKLQKQKLKNLTITIKGVIYE